MSNVIHLGRDTDLTRDHWESITRAIAPAPTLFRGARPRKTMNWRFLYARYAGQLIGCCTGEGNAQGLQFMSRLPADLNPLGTPRPGVAISPLAIYLQSRLYSKSLGIRMGSEGAIVSHAALAISDADGGVVLYENYPSTPEAYRGYSDRVVLGAKCLADKKSHIVQYKARVTTADGLLDAMASGRAVIVGTNIPTGMTDGTDDLGRFEWRGRVAGGHCYLAVDYDLDLDLIYLRNSWDNAKWGNRTGSQPSPMGVTSLSAWLNEFSDRNMSSGVSEAIVYDDDGGWSPKLLYDFSQY